MLFIMWDLFPAGRPFPVMCCQPKLSAGIVLLCPLEFAFKLLKLLLGLPLAANCDTRHTTFAICHPCYFIPSLFYYSRLTRKITVLGSSVEELRRRLDTLSPPSKGQVGWAAQYEGDLHAP